MANTTESRFGQPLTLALTEKERQELKQAKSKPITFDSDCPETTPEQALKFRRVNPLRRTAQ